MAQRQLPKEVQQMFDRYAQGSTRRLPKADALKMLEAEFQLSPKQAEDMFATFDNDKNGIMSILEFQQFYMCVGNGARDMVRKFEEMDKDGSGQLDLEEARQGLKTLLVGGRQLEDREIDFFLKSSVSDNGQVDIGHFANLLFKLKVYEKRQQKK